jgi:NAD(P)H-flavin reductase
MKNPYCPVEATVEKVITETPTIKTFCIDLKEPIKFRAGQFMQLSVPGFGEAPFTPSSSPSVTDKMEITILKTGKVTDFLHDTVKRGDTVGLRGPYGKGYPIDKMKGKEVLVIGGGVGLAPLRSLIHALFETIDDYRKVWLKYGAKKPEELCYRSSYEDWGKKKNVDFKVTIDVPAPGWAGHVGLVTTLLDDMKVDVPNSIAVSCGPSIMLKFVTLKLLDVGYKEKQIYISMNRRMSCGTGRCGRCQIGPYYLCKDGPDICYDLIKDIPEAFA